MAVSENDVKIQTTNMSQPPPGSVVYIQKEEESSARKCWNSLFCCCQAFVIADGCLRCLCCCCDRSIFCSIFIAKNILFCEFLDENMINYMIVKLRNILSGEERLFSFNCIEIVKKNFVGPRAKN
ncbi:hypothetical protein BpHYR1_051364 [Brachionus plicatilis]|uniref:Uncharacterized protein n=1 Tax=Brachionus plicatilis TaxID=10195 RepID=A0A3M7RJY4_BRAPC|nr:hypothetical protein BpHYR1_051364 [Brachionus plicatilis]